MPDVAISCALQDRLLAACEPTLKPFRNLIFEFFFLAGENKSRLCCIAGNLS